MTERIDIKYVLKDTKANWVSFNPTLSKGIIIYETDTNLIKLCDGISDYNSLSYIGGTGGSSTTVDYTSLSNKPQINSIELTGNKTLDQLGIQAKGNYLVSTDLNNYALKTELPTKTSDLINDSGFLTNIPSEYVTETELNNELQDKANKATTLSGYGIADAYTKTETDSKYATKTELATKADSSALPASTSLMNGNAPSIADFIGTDAEGLKTELNALLAQLKTRGVIA